MATLGQCKEAIAALRKVQLLPSASADVYSNTATYFQLCGELVVGDGWWACGWWVMGLWVVGGGWWVVGDGLVAAQARVAFLSRE